MRQLYEEYEIDHVKSTPYYPQGNGQAEATNKTFRNLSRMVYDGIQFKTFRNLSTGCIL